MARLKTYEEFVNENIGAALGSPIKYTKIKNNLKKYQKSLVQKALNDLDYQKKKEKAGNLTTDQTKKLELAKDAKNKAVGEIADLTSQRIDDLATTDKLKKVASLGKTKSKLAANKVILKAADGDMKAALKKKEAKLQAKATQLTQQVKADVGDAPKADDKVKPADTAKKDDNKAVEDAKAAVEKAKKAYDAVKDGDDEKAKLDAEIKFKQAQQKKAKAEGNSELVQGLGDDIGEIMKKARDLDNTPDDPGAELEGDIKAFNDNIEAERTRMKKDMKDLDQAKRDLNTGRGSEDKIQKLEKSIEDSKEDIAELKRKEADAKKELANLSKTKESFKYVAESVSEKFSRLMKDV